jgi:hypothetical protein
MLGASTALLMLAGSALAGPIAVQVNGEPVSFPYAQPTQIAGRVMIPLRGVLERLGADRIDWRPQRQEVSVSGSHVDLQLRIGERMAQVNGRQVPLDVPPLILQNTTMVPLRFVSENLGARVDWLPGNQTVYIATPNERVAGSRERIPDRTPDRSTQVRPLPRDRQVIVRDRPATRDQVDQSTRLRSADLTGLFPRQASTVSDLRPEISARFRPGAAIDFNTVNLSLNGRDVTRDAEITTEGVRFRPLDDVRRGRNDVRLTFHDTRGVTTTQDWYFFAP